MNQDWQEKEIRQLFRNERRVDESLSPDFAATLEAALSRTGRVRTGHLILRVTFAVVALAAVAGFVFFLLGRSSREHAPSVVTSPGNAVIEPPAAIIEPVPRSSEPPAKSARRARAHRPSPERAAALISQWRSPTNFLLKTPGDDLLRTVPRVGESVVEIKLNLSPTKN